MTSRFSQDIKQLLQRLADHPLTLGDILAETSERGFCLAIALLVLPFLFPMPPGVTGILGSGSFLLALQMVLGRRSPWLPKKVTNYKFPRWFILQLLKNLQRITGIVERFARRRLVRIVENPQVWRINGACIAWLSILLVLPVPFTNPIPTVGILLFVIATLESDGLLMCVSYVSTALITGFFGFIGYLVWQVPSLLHNS